MRRLLLLAVLPLAACATINHGPNETISVDSRPSGAQATIRCDGNVTATGTTPARLTIPRRADNCRLEVGSKTVEMTRGLSGKFWMNFATAGAGGVAATAAWGGSDTAIFAGPVIVVSGGVGLLIDRISGSMWDRDEHTYVIDLGEPANR